MEKVKKTLAYLFVFSVIAVVYRGWFMPGVLTGGDFNMTFHSMYSNQYIYPYAWYWNQGSGLGGNAVSLLWIYFNYATTSFIFGEILGLSWRIFERFAYLYPFLLIATISSITLAKYILSKKSHAVLASLLFVLNTYILMIAEGGQIWILLAYSLSPMALFLFIKTIDTSAGGSRGLHTKQAILTGLVFSLLMMLELRIAYIILFAGFIYWFLNFPLRTGLKDLLKTFIFGFIIPGIISLGVHAFWLFPTIFLHQNLSEQLGAAYTTANAVVFFSFAKFENTISLLHPNWPENIFGKTYFMRSEFLLIPIIAFSSLFFVKKLKNSKEALYIIFFIVIALLGAFLAKGANEPFGSVYLWMFDHIPGFIMFRDPTKWYVLVAISYSILIPFSIEKIYRWLEKKKLPNLSKVFNFHNAFLLALIFYFLFLLRPAFFGQLSGTFKPTTVPKDYVNLENYLSTQKTFFRVLWFPQFQRFGLSSSEHPAISAEGFYGKYQIEQLLLKLKTDQAKKVLVESSIKFVVVPYDTDGEIYLKNRRYDSALYLKTLHDISKISYLKKVNGFGKIGVYEITGTKDHFWSPSESLHVSYAYINPVKILVTVKNAKKGNVLVFAESYDSRWQAVLRNTAFSSQKYDGLFNSFVLPENGDYTLTVLYTPQKLVTIGVWISTLTLISAFSCLGFIFLSRRKMVK